jgi:hypothetical protein
MADPNKEFVGKERVCDKDVEKELWKLNEEPKIMAKESKEAAGNGEEKSMAGDQAEEEMVPGIKDVAAHSSAL